MEIKFAQSVFKFGLSQDFCFRQWEKYLNKICVLTCDNVTVFLYFYKTNIIYSLNPDHAMRIGLADILKFTENNYS